MKASLQREGRRAASIWALVGDVAFGAAAAGAILTLLTLVGQQAPPNVSSFDGPIDTGGLAIQLDRAGWVDAGHEPDQGFAMPGSMMPGFPAEGKGRFHVELTLLNRSGAVRSYSSKEFLLRSNTGDTWAPANSSEASGFLGPRQTIHMDLFFDVPEAAGSLSLAWNRDGRQLLIPAPDEVGSAHHGE